MRGRRLRQGIDAGNKRHIDSCGATVASTTDGFTAYELSRESAGVGRGGGGGGEYLKISATLRTIGAAQARSQILACRRIRMRSNDCVASPEVLLRERKSGYTPIYFCYCDDLFAGGFGGAFICLQHAAPSRAY